MKGFTKDGKFRPTGSSSGLKSSQILSGFQVGDKVVFSRVQSSVFNLPPRKLFNVDSKAVGIGNVLGTGKVTKIENVKFPHKKGEGLVHIKTDKGISGTVGHFAKYDSKSKYRLSQNGGVEKVDAR